MKIWLPLVSFYPFRVHRPFPVSPLLLPHLLLSDSTSHSISPSSLSSSTISRQRKRRITWIERKIQSINFPTPAGNILFPYRVDSSIWNLKSSTRSRSYHPPSSLLFSSLLYIIIYNITLLSPLSLFLYYYIYNLFSFILPITVSIIFSIPYSLSSYL